MNDNSYLIILPYTAVSFSLIARLFFMYILKLVLIFILYHFVTLVFFHLYYGYLTEY